MVENSLGRLWLESHPNATLKANWKYYLDEVEQTPEVAERLRVLRAENPVKSPEDIRLIDPCMGSGHILVYAFDVLMQIYESEGYNPRDTVKLILEKNIYGLDIDRRAYQLAYFSLIMKARQYNRHILTKGYSSKVYTAVSSKGVSKHHLEFMGAGFSPLEINAAKDSLEYLIELVADGDEYGSLLKVERDLDYNFLRRFITNTKEGQLRLGDDVSIYSTLDQTQNTLLCMLDVAQTLAAKYDVVVTNPPYMGSSGMGAKLSEYVKFYYPDSKSDLFAVFIEKCGEILNTTGYQAMITQHAWMFLTSYENLRGKLIHRDIVNMAHLGARAFEEIGGEVVQTTAFVLSKCNTTSFEATYVRLVDYNSQQKKEEAFLSGSDRYTSKKENFEKIPGSPVAYWVGQAMLAAFGASKKLKDIAEPRQGLATANNDRFLRLWYEVVKDRIGLGYESMESANKSGSKWFPYNKGGEFRKWYGNNDYLVNWENDGYEIRNFGDGTGYIRSRAQNTQFYFKQSITWSFVSSSFFGVRFSPPGALFDVGGSSVFPPDEMKFYLTGFLCSKLSSEFMKIQNPTLNFQVGNVASLPVITDKTRKPKIDETVAANIFLSRSDWDAFETSWDFIHHPLISGERTITAAFDKWEREAAERFDRLKANEEELNRIFIDIYGLQDELKPEVEDKDVTVRRADLGREIRSLISYAVGCMFGRYSLDCEGLAYAGGDWDASKYSTIIPDKDNILPICDDEYFEDDIVGRFVDFIRVAYGAETLEENLKFIADALGGKGTPREVIRSYFLNDFFADHCKIYQKRPIYWLFDSGKKNGFKALVYLHRYSRDLLAKMRTDYVHEQQERYRTQLSHIATALNTATGAERAKLLKQQDKLAEQLKEITAFEEKVHHLADQNITIDLDDGVKKNYEIFADVLAKT